MPPNGVDLGAVARHLVDVDGAAAQLADAARDRARGRSVHDAGREAVRASRWRRAIASSRSRTRRIGRAGPNVSSRDELASRAARGRARTARSARRRARRRRAAARRRATAVATRRSIRSPPASSITRADVGALVERIADDERSRRARRCRRASSSATGSTRDDALDRRAALAAVARTRRRRRARRPRRGRRPSSTSSGSLPPSSSTARR